jgi:23S rRNA pseudouridine1911/1915/1917 synthase
MRTFIADRGDARLRLDQAIVRRLTDVPRLSRTLVQRWIDEQQVLVNDRPARRASAVVASGDRVDVLALGALETFAPPQAEDAPIEVLYEDAYLLAVNKCAGMVVHPSYKNSSGTLLNALLGHMRVGPKPDTTIEMNAAPANQRPSLVNRLDKDTSGVLLVAKSADMHARLQRVMADGNTQKIYLAVVNGRPRAARGTISLPLGRDDGDRRRMVVRSDGQASTTRYEVLLRGRELSALRCALLTGRTHQIRVHLAASGWPIVGDAVYGRSSALIARQALHAWRLTFPHPVSGKTTEVVAPPPPDIAGLLEDL